MVPAPFDAFTYLVINEDILNAECDPYCHYIKWEENRVIKVEF
jgi:hypothetical protein